MKKPIIGIIMGSDSDLPTMQEAAKICEEFNVPYEIKILLRTELQNLCQVMLKGLISAE